MSDTYDVIVIGSCAGGARCAIWPLGQADPAARARRLAHPRAADWLAQDVFVDGRHASVDTWYYPHPGTRSNPRVH